MNLRELRTAIEQQAALMVAVATGGPQINTVQDQYATRRDQIEHELQRLSLDDPNPFRDLWAWYGYYSQNLGRWHERRTYISEMYEPLHERLDSLAEQDVGTRLDEEDRTGWERVDDQIVQLRQRYTVALTVEDFQAIGLLCRDVFVSLAESIFDADRHSKEGEEAPTTLRDQLFAVIEHEAAGAASKELRALLKATIAYANKVQHDRSATRHQARVVAEATIATVNVVRAITVEQETDLIAVREAWPSTVLPAIRDHSIPLAAILQEAQPVAFDGDRLVLGFALGADFHRRIAAEPANARVVKDVLRDVIGRTLLIEFVVIDEDSVP